VLSNLKTSFSGTFHALRFDKYADRYLGAFSYRFNRRFDLAAIPGDIPRGFPSNPGAMLLCTSLC